MSNNKNINKLEYPSNPNKIYKNRNGYNFTIKDAKTKSVVTSSGNKRWNKYFLVHFIDTGFEKWSQNKEVNTGNIKDWFAPDVCGVGIVGLEIEKPQSHYLYDRWRDMLRRCYDESCKSYHAYGGDGCVVCDEWKYFPKFVCDIENKPNFEKLKLKPKNINDRYEIDKDTVKQGNKVYCNEYTCIITRRENMKERNKRLEYNRESNIRPVLRINDSFTEFVRYPSIVDACKDLENPSPSCISSVCKGRLITYKGFYWQYDDGLPNEDVIRNINDKTRLAKLSKKQNNKKDYVFISHKGEVYSEFFNVTIGDIAIKTSIPRGTLYTYRKSRKYKGVYNLKTIEEVENNEY